MKFLLIEYEPRYLEQIRQYLAAQSQAIELVVARDGEEGLELYRKARPDLVLISSVLPKLRTPEVIRAMQEMGPTPPVLLMMSGYKGRNRRTDAQRVGATSILEKPFTEDTFHAEVSMALGHRPAIEMPPPPRPKSDPNMPLLSADDIFSDVLTGLADEDALLAKPGAPVTPAAGPSVEKLLHDTLSGLMPQKKAASGPSAPFPAAEGPRERPTERTARVNVAEAMANLSARPASAPRAPEPAARAAASASPSSSVDKLLKDTLSGLKPGPKAPAPAAAARPKEVSREVSDATVRLSVASPPPRVPAPPVASPPANLPPPEMTRPVPTVPPASSPGRFGRYQLLEKIGAGGMAEVFKARMSGERGFEKIVAIKRIVPHMATNTDFVTMFVDEAKLAAQLNHNNITHIYDLGKVDAWHYIAMEYVAGKDLRTLLKVAKEKDVPLPPELALFIASKIANALDYAHRRLAPDGSELHLVHRDVSPQNILISEEGDIKLCDFGIAKAASKVSTTMSGALKGKLQYMSPEQAWGKRLDRRSDIFSLGSVLFEMLTGAPLFEGDTEMSVLESVRLGDVVPPTSRGVEVPKRVDEIVLKALAKNPQERYQNASELEKDLHAVLYTFQPAPGPADLAIYMNRLLEAPAPSEVESDAEIDAAFDAARDVTPPPAAAPEVPPRKGKGLVIVKAPSGEVPRPRVPAPEPHPEPAPRRAVGESTGAPVLLAAGESKKSRTGLVAGIGLAAAVLVGGVLFVTKDRWSGAKPTVGEPAPKTEAQTASSVPAPATSSVAPPVAEPPKIIDPKAVEAEARRLAQERDKAARDAAKSGAAAKAATGPAASAVGLAPVKAAEPPRPSEVAPAPTEAPKPAEPTPVPAAAVRAPETRPAEVVPEAAPKPAPPPVDVAPPDKPPVIPAASGEPVKEGDMVGPGEGVVEPRLVRLGAMGTLPAQARQIKRGADGSIGTPFLMALVDERGAVQEIRVIRPSNYRFVDEAAVRALKSATILPATKDGVKVKMWKTFPINVKP